MSIKKFSEFKMLEGRTLSKSEFRIFDDVDYFNEEDIQNVDDYLLHLKEDGYEITRSDEKKVPFLKIHITLDKWKSGGFFEKNVSSVNLLSENMKEVVNQLNIFDRRIKEKFKDREIKIAYEPYIDFDTSEIIIHLDLPRTKIPRSYVDTSKTVIKG